MQKLECPQIIFFDGSVTLQITASAVTVVEQLSNNQEEADMTLCYCMLRTHFLRMLLALCLFVHHQKKSISTCCFSMYYMKIPIRWLWKFQEDSAAPLILTMNTIKPWLISIPSLAMTISLPTFESARITVGKWLKSITCRSTFFQDTSSVEYG